MSGQAGLASRAARLGALACLAVAGLSMTPASAAAIDFHLITIAVSPTNFDPPGSGTVTTGDGSIDCIVTDGLISGTCSHSYLAVTSVVIDWTFTPAAGSAACVGLQCQTAPDSYQFEYTNSTTLTGEGFKVVSAHVSVHVVGSGQLNVNGTPAIDGDVLPFTVPQTLTIAAIPGTGSAWSSFGGACSGQGQPCIVSLKGDSSVTVTFASIATAPPTVAPSHPAPSQATASPRPTQTTTHKTPGPGATATPASGSPEPSPESSSEPSQSPGPGATPTPSPVPGPPPPPFESGSGVLVLLLVLLTGLSGGGALMYGVSKRRAPGEAGQPPTRQR